MFISKKTTCIDHPAELSPKNGKMKLWGIWDSGNSGFPHEWFLYLSEWLKPKINVTHQKYTLSRNLGRLIRGLILFCQVPKGTRVIANWLLDGILNNPIELIMHTLAVITDYKKFLDMFKPLLWKTWFSFIRWRQNTIWEYEHKKARQQTYMRCKVFV